MLVSILRILPALTRRGVVERFELTNCCRHLDTTSFGVCYPQDFHLHSGAFDSRGHTKGRQGVKGMGVGYWEAETEGIESCIV